MGLPAFLEYLKLAIHDVFAGRAVRNHADRNTEVLFGKLDVMTCVLREILELLDAADIDRCIDQGSTTTLFAGMFAHKSACGGEGVVFTDHVDCASVVALANQGDISRNVYMRRTHGLTRNSLSVAFLT